MTTLGTPSLVENSGLHFLIPFVQSKTIISKNIQGITIGYNAKTNETIESESVMITVDYNFVDVDFYLEWKVTDPIKYLYASSDPGRDHLVERIESRHGIHTIEAAAALGYGTREYELIAY